MKAWTHLFYLLNLFSYLILFREWDLFNYFLQNEIHFIHEIY